MDLLTEQDITGAVAKAIRLELGMTQNDFWGPLGRSKKQASNYENEFHDRPLPDIIRMLVFIRYYLGFNFDISSPQGVKEAKVAMGRIHGPSGLEEAEAAAKAQEQQCKDLRNDVTTFIEGQIFDLLELKKRLQEDRKTAE